MGITYHVHGEALEFAKPCGECGRPIVWIGTDTRPRALDVDGKERAQAGGFELPPHAPLCERGTEEEPL